MDNLIESISLELDITKEEIERFIANYGERLVKEQLISISANNLNNKVDNPLVVLEESLKKLEPKADKPVQVVEINKAVSKKDNSEDKLEKLFKEALEMKRQIETSIDNLEKSVSKIENYYELKDKNVGNNKTGGDGDYSRFGFYCLLTILSMLFYIVGAFAYFVWDTTLFSRVNSYVLSISIPCVILGIAIGIMYKPILKKIFKRKAHDA